MLVTAFLRALKDPFPQARIAAIGSIGATHSYYSVSDLSSRLLPTLCTITVDKEKAVRDQAFLTIKFFLAKLEKISEDPQAAAEQEKIDGTNVHSLSPTPRRRDVCGHEVFLQVRNHYEAKDANAF